MSRIFGGRATRSIVILTAFNVLATAAWSAPGERGEATDREALQRTLAEAAKAFREGDHARALVGFRAAEPAVVALGDLADFRWNLARTLEALGNYPEALVEFDRALSLPDSPENQAETQSRRDLLFRSRFGALEVSCDAPGTRLVLSAQSPSRMAPEPSEATCPYTWSQLLSAAYVVEAHSVGGVVVRRTQAVPSGNPTQLHLTLPGALSVLGDPDTVVHLDGEPVGPAPLAEHPVAAGAHEVTVQRAGQVIWRYHVQLPAGARLELDARPAPGLQVTAARGEGRGPTDRPGAWLSGAGSLVAFGAGAAFLILAQGASDDAASTKAAYKADPGGFDRTATETAIDNHLSDFERNRAIGFGSLALGAVFAGLSTWLFLRDGESRPSAQRATDDLPP